MFCGRGGGSGGGFFFDRLPRLGFTLAFGSAKVASISALRAARSSFESCARVSWLVPLWSAFERGCDTLAYLRTSFVRALARFLLPFCLRESQRCRRLIRLSSDLSALGLAMARPSEHCAIVLMPLSTPMGSPLAGV